MLNPKTWFMMFERLNTLALACARSVGASLMLWPSSVIGDFVFVMGACSVARSSWVGSSCKSLMLDSTLGCRFNPMFGVLAFEPLTTTGGGLG